MIWMGIFSFLWWVVSLGLWLCVDTLFVSETGWILTPLLIVRNLAITLPVTKICTHPFRGWFQSSHVTTTEIIGKECEISSSEATTNLWASQTQNRCSPFAAECKDRWTAPSERNSRLDYTLRLETSCVSRFPDFS